MGRATERRARCLTDLESDRYFDLLDRLDELMTTPPWTEQADAQAQIVLTKRVRQDFKRLARRVARALEAERGALRLSPDEWMLPMFGDSNPDGLRDVLEDRLLWVAHRALHGGLDVVVDVGLWGRQERAALARHTAARCEVRHCHVEEEQRRTRIDQRWAKAPNTTFAMTEDDHAANLAVFQAPDEDELAGQQAARPPAPYERWAAWAVVRWRSLPSWDGLENWGAQPPSPSPA